MKKYGNYVEGISKQKLYKQGYSIYLEYWSDRVSQQNILVKLINMNNISNYVYTQKKDKTGLWKVIVYIKK